MSDEFTVMEDDDDDQTLILDGMDGTTEEGNFAVEVAEDDETIDEDSDDDRDNEGDADFEEEFDEDVTVTTAAYKPDSNIYTALILLTSLAYVGALTVVLMELYDYCDQSKFMWGMFAK